MTDFPDVKLKALVNFPALVEGGVGIAVSQDGGKFTFDLSVGEIAQISSLPAPSFPTTFIVLWDAVSNSYRRISITDFKTSLGIP